LKAAVRYLTLVCPQARTLLAMFMSADDEPYLQLDKVGGAQGVGRILLQHCV